MNWLKGNELFMRMMKEDISMISYKHPERELFTRLLMSTRLEIEASTDTLRDGVDYPWTTKQF